ncbi:uncharacterized protein LOC123305823 [Chrysoperla carnea]|uniref:uncharacterized protein LOC123305823 n=1 Tax=Chrysoperla carnea TaxID=189513 RepID=UPI001D08A6AD|nr:uncharacterized protein LOC123305823 [Chrysoperla carnea]
MASTLAGKYEYKSHEKLVEFYKTWHLPESAIEKLVPKAGTTREISVDGNKITLDGGQPLTLDSEVDETINNYPVKSTAKMEGNTLIVHSKSVKHEGNVLIRSYSADENLLTIAMKEINWLRDNKKSDCPRRFRAESCPRRKFTPNNCPWSKNSPKEDFKEKNQINP